MPQSKPPFKLALAALFLDDKARGAAEAAEELRPEYAGFNFFTSAFVACQLHSLKAVGILQTDEAGAYSLSKSGAERVKKNL